jgi:putative transcription factor
MEECELCGKPISDTVYIVEVEGVNLRVCSKCSQRKHVIQKISLNQPKIIREPIRSQEKKEDDVELVNHFGNVIKNARENEKLPLKVLAEMIKEQESYIKRIEEEKTVPPQNIIEKLERALNIKLTIAKIDKPENVVIKNAKEPTLGDYIKK